MAIDLSPITRFVEGEMTDTVLIARNSSEDVFDEWTGQYNVAYNSPLYEGKGLVLPINAYPNEEPEGMGQAKAIRTA